MARLGYHLVVVVLAVVSAQTVPIAGTIWLTAGTDRWKTWSGPFCYDATATVWFMPDGTWAAEQTGNDPIFFGEGTWTGTSKRLDLTFDAAGYGELIGWDLTGELQELGEPEAWATADIWWAKVKAKIKSRLGKVPQIQLVIQWRAWVEFHGTAKFALGPWRFQRVTKTKGELWASTE